MIEGLALKVRATVEASRKAAFERHDKVGSGGPGLAGEVREGSEAEARRVVGSKLL